MSVSGISAAVPAIASPIHSAPAKPLPTSAPASTKPTSAPSATQSAASIAVATVSAAAAALTEATETSAQTAKEAAGGDRAAQRILAKQDAAVGAHSGGSAGNASTVIKTSAQSAVSAPGSIIDDRA
jgi:hypothetical protein